jgi:hypothetical protein
VPFCAVFSMNLKLNYVQSAAWAFNTIRDNYQPPCIDERQKLSHQSATEDGPFLGVSS